MSAVPAKVWSIHPSFPDESRATFRVNISNTKHPNIRSGISSIGRTRHWRILRLTTETPRRLRELTYRYKCAVFQGEAISGMYMKRQFPSSFLPPSPSHTSLHRHQTHLMNGICTLMKFALHHFLVFISESDSGLYLLVSGLTNGRSRLNRSLDEPDSSRSVDALELISSRRFSGQIFITGFICTFGAV